MARPPPKSAAVDGPDTSESTDSILYPRSPPSEENRGRTRARRPPTPEIEGYHTFTAMNRKFVVEKRWKFVREMGVGAFGAVVAAQDAISGETVAIKQVVRVFDKVPIAKRCLRELTLLRHLQGHLHITGLIDMDMLSKDANEIYMFMEPMEADLHQIIRSGQELSNDHVAYFMYQILGAMQFIHGCNVMHRDLKPGNILVNSSCAIRICDFGLARGYVAPDNDMIEKVSDLTNYVCTRWYRAPEIMLGFPTYTNAIDMWSIGCIMVELFLLKPAFQGRDYVDQLNCIFSALGSPSDHVLDRIAKGRARKYVRGLPWRKGVSFEKWIPRADPDAIDLLGKLLTYIPESRISAKQGLDHPWLLAFADPEEESLSPKPRPFTRWQVIESLETIDQFRDAIWTEVQDYRRFARSVVDELVVTPEGLATKEFAEAHGHIPKEASGHVREPSIAFSVGMPELQVTHSPDEDEKAEAEDIVTTPGGPSYSTATLPRPRTRTRTLSSHDPFTHARRSSIFSLNSPGSAAPVPVSASLGTASTATSYAQFPSVEDPEGSTDGNYTPTTVPVRQRLVSRADSSDLGTIGRKDSANVYRHLRTLSTVSIYESAARPGGLEAVAPIGKLVGAVKTAGADGPPSTPPEELVAEDKSDKSSPGQPSK